MSCGCAGMLMLVFFSNAGGMASKRALEMPGTERGQPVLMLGATGSHGWQMRVLIGCYSKPI
jgi:hypothetical protein